MKVKPCYMCKTDLHLKLRSLYPYRSSLSIETGTVWYVECYGCSERSTACGSIKMAEKAWNSQVGFVERQQALAEEKRMSGRRKTP